VGRSAMQTLRVENRRNFFLDYSVRGSFAVFSHCKYVCGGVGERYNGGYSTSVLTMHVAFC
jgi:hypothetical protein